MTGEACLPPRPAPSSLLQTVQTLLEGETGLLKITKKFNHRLHETVVRLYTTSGGTAKARGDRGVGGVVAEAEDAPVWEPSSGCLTNTASRVNWRTVSFSSGSHV